MKRVVLPGFLFLAVLVAGCFGSKKNPVKAQPPYTYSRATPQDVLVSLVHAYGARDSTEYAKLYAPDYRGASYDTSDAPGPQPGTFTFNDEVRHIRALAAHPTVLAVSLNLGSSGTWVRTATKGSAEEDWAEIIIYNPHLQIDATVDSYSIQSGELFTFAFSPETPAPASPTDTLWSIVRWTEDAPQVP